MKQFHKTASLILLLTVFLLACMGPTNIQGVVLSNGEIINFEKLESLGSHGGAYLKESY